MLAMWAANKLGNSGERAEEREKFDERIKKPRQKAGGRW